MKILATLFVGCYKFVAGPPSKPLSHKQKFSAAQKRTASASSADRRKSGRLSRVSRAETLQPAGVKSAWVSRHPRVMISIILAACLVPFINKAVHTDDVLFVWTGQWIQKHPLDFFGGQVNWWTSAVSMWMANYNPPLLSYFLAAAAVVIGWSETAMHLACLGVAVLAAQGVYSLAKLWCPRPFLATMIAIFTPAFLVSSTTLMCDVMMLGFWVWALVLWEQALGMERSAWRFIVAGTVAGLAVLTKYSAINLLPLLFLLSVLRIRKPGWWLLGLALPVLMLAGYELITARLYGRGLFFAAVHYAHTTYISFPGGWRAKGIIDLAFTGGSLLPTLFFVPWLWPRRVWLAGGILMLGGLALLFRWWDNIGLSNTAPDMMKQWDFLLQAVLLTAGGLHLLLLLAAEIRRRRDIITLILVLWIAGTIYFATVLNWTVNVRSFLPLVPAVAILLVRRLESFRGGFMTGGRLLWPLIPAAAIALGIATADYQLANSARTAATLVVAKYRAPNQTIWFEGHGAFQYYMEQSGGQPLDVARSVLQPADIIAIPEIGAFVALPANTVGWVEHLSYEPTFRIKVVGGDDSGLAGFYGANFGPLPFLLGRPSYQDYTVFKVFLRMQFISQPSNPQWLQTGEMPVFPNNRCQVDGKPIFNAAPEIMKQCQDAAQLAATGRIEEAIQGYRDVLNADSNNPVALGDLAWILATAGKPTLRNGAEAVQLATRAVELTNYRLPRLIQVLGAAYAETGRFSDAVQYTQISRAVALITGQKEIDASNLRLLDLYCSGKSIAAMKLAGGSAPAVLDDGGPPP